MVKNNHLKHMKNTAERELNPKSYHFSHLVQKKIKRQIKTKINAIY